MSAVVRLLSDVESDLATRLDQIIRYDRISKRANVKIQMSDNFFRRDTLFDHDNGYHSVISIPPLNSSDSVFDNTTIIRLHQNSIQRLSISGITYLIDLRLILQHRQYVDSLQKIRHFPNMPQSFPNMSQQISCLNHLNNKSPDSHVTSTQQPGHGGGNPYPSGFRG